MMLNSDQFIPMTEANQNFSKVVRLVDESGTAIILKNNKPRYMVMTFTEYEEIQTARQKFIGTVTDDVISENIDALNELAK